MLQQVLNGLSIGSVYASLAVGFSLIYGILEFPHFAHGITMMVAAYAGYVAAALSRSFLMAILAATIAGGLMSLFMEFVGYRLLRIRNIPKIYYLALSMGFCIFFENFAINTIGAQFKVYPAILSGSTINAFGLTLGLIDMIALGLAVIFLAVFSYIIFKTPAGLAIRASSNNIEATQLMGVDMDHIMRFIFFMAGAAAGFAGVILGIKYTVYPQLWFITNKVFVATVFGGLGSLTGAIVASLIVGLLEAFITAYISSEMSSLFVFALLIVVLMLRPQGLFGKIIEDKA